MNNQPPRYRYYQPTRASVAVATYQHQPGSVRKLLTFTTVVTTATIGILFLFGQLAPAIAKEFTPGPPKPSYSQAAIASAVGSVLQQSGDAQIGVALEDMTTGQMMTYGQNVPFEAASTAKVLTAANYYHLVENGQASLSKPMGAYNAQFQIKEMINISDNDAWHLLTNSIGNSELAAYASSIGIHYDVATNAMAPSDMATLLTKLYTGKLLNQTDTDQLLSYMQNTNDEDLIPAAVNSDITVYHKYGLLNGELHDAAILVKGNQAFSLVIYTKNADDSDDQTRAGIIHQLTTAVTSNIFS